MTRDIPPLSVLRAGERRWSGIVADLAAMEAARGMDGVDDWPPYCILPINAAFTALVAKYGLTPWEAARHAAELTGAYCWDRHRIVYQFDPTLARTLAEQAQEMEDTDVLPAELLMRLPYPCVYLALPGLHADLDGALVWVDWDTNRQAPELRAQYCYRDGSTEPGVLHLVQGTIRECIEDTNAEVARNAGPDAPQLSGTNSQYVQRILSIIQFVLYLVSERADVDVKTTPRPKRIRGQHGKKTPERPVTTGTVGIHIGAAIRRQQSRPAAAHGSTGTGAAKRPHTRRGHWHHYWVGPHDTPERRLVLRWTPPTLIHPEDGGKDVSIYPVK